jgi:hypothetical protein
VTASRAEVSAGESVEFYVVARNPTERILRFATNTCVLVVRLLDHRGFPVFESPDACNDIALSHELEAGGLLEETVLFDGTTSWGPFIDDSGGEARYTLAAGVYQVVAGVSSSFLNPSTPVEIRIR